MKKPQVVIVGGGFGGMAAARALRNAPVDVTLVDARNHFIFQPLLYQVALGALEPEEIAHSTRTMLRGQQNLRVQIGRVTGGDLGAKQLVLEDGQTLHFDKLILALGAVGNDFGVPGVREHAFGLKSLEDAVRLRQHLVSMFEQAAAAHRLRVTGEAEAGEAAAHDPALLNFVVVGGGPTGVEVAGALPELIATVFARDFAPELAQRARVTLLEATQTLLPAFHPSLRQYTAQTLRNRHVDVRFGAQVTAIGPDAIHLKDGTSIPTRTVIWGAGVKAHPLGAALGLPLGRGGRVAINDDLSVPGVPDVFVIGDMAAGKDTAGQIYPQLAQGAMQSGKHVAGNIVRALQGRALLPFAYRDPGFMATIGRHAAVAQFPFGLRASGVLAWWMWLVLHLVQLVGFRNRAQVLLNWTWNYLRGYKHPLLYGQQSSAPPDVPARP